MKKVKIFFAWNQEVNADGLTEEINKWLSDNADSIQQSSLEFQINSNKDGVWILINYIESY